MKTKFPREYLREEIGEVFDPLTPRFRFDTHGRLVLPFTPYQKMTLSTIPGSTDVKQGMESEAGKPLTDPGSLKTGVLHAETVITIGGTIKLDAVNNRISVGASPGVSGYAMIISSTYLIGTKDTAIRFGYFLSDYSANFMAGDFFVGNLTANKYIFWDESGGDLLVKGSITASTITGGTITGALIQTAVSGLRIRLSSSPDNKIEFLQDNTVHGVLEIAQSGDDFVLKLGGDGGSYLTIISSMGAAQAYSVSLPFFEAAGKASVGWIYMTGSPNFPTKAGLIWSGGDVAFFSTDLGDELAKVGCNWIPFFTGLDLGSSSDYWNNLYLNYIRFNPSYGRIFVSSTWILDFLETKLACSVPFGLQIRSGTPGAAASWQGFMYYDTDQSDIVFSNGTDWYKVTATAI